MKDGDVVPDVEITVGPRSPSDVEIKVNGHEASGVTSFRIHHSVDAELPRLELSTVAIDGVLFKAHHARLLVETACQQCGFTHRQPLLPISENDAAELKEALRALENPITADLEARAQYIQSLLRDIRATLDAYSPFQYGGDPALLAQAEASELHQGRPDGNLATYGAGVDFAREALASQRQRATEEGSSAAGGEADGESGGPASDGNREGKGGNSTVGHGQPSKEDYDWPPQFEIGEDSED